MAASQPHSSTLPLAIRSALLPRLTASLTFPRSVNKAIRSSAGTATTFGPPHLRSSASGYQAAAFRRVPEDILATTDKIMRDYAAENVSVWLWLIYAYATGWYLQYLLNAVVVKHTVAVWYARCSSLYELLYYVKGLFT